MPYLYPSERPLVRLPESIPGPGALNYIFTLTMVSYVAEHGLSYDTMNDVSGAMTEALAEFRRRVIAPYEDTKSAVNGDVYPSFLAE